MLAPTSNRSRSNRSPYDPPNTGDAGYSPSMMPASEDGAYAPPSAGSSSTGGGNMPPPNFYSGAYAPPNGPRLETDTAKIAAPVMARSFDSGGPYSPLALRMPASTPAPSIDM